MKLEQRPLYKLIPYAGNVMEHGQEQVNDIANGIVEYGFNNPVLIAEDGTIIAGHGRVLAAKQLGLEKVPCIVLAHLNEAQRRAYALADNKIARKSTFNLEKLASELEELAKLEINLAGLGFNESELDALLESVNDILPEPAPWRPEPPYITSDAAEPQGTGRPSPTQVSGELAEVDRSTAQSPKQPQDEYSRFELVMLHANKQALVSVLSRIRKAQGFEKIEDALMHLVGAYLETEEEQDGEDGSGVWKG